MPRPYVRLRETTFDLYVERDLLPGYYRFISLLSSWLVLAGYILFAIVFTTETNNLSATRNLVTVVASSLLVVGYVGILAVALLSRSLLFMVDGVIYPTLTASLLGLFTTVANFALHSNLATSQIYMSVPLVTACITTVVSAVVLIVAYRELRKIKRRDERRRWHANIGPYMNSQNDHQLMPVIPSQDDEAQRRQLMRLLQERRESAMTQEEIMNTFKIGLPGEPRYDTRREREMDQLLHSPNQGGFNLSNLLPWKKGKEGTFKDARERRREEIERSSVANLGDTWRTHDPNYQQQQQQQQQQGAQPTTWGWPPATRYA